jgi:hypothetical protein
LPKNVFLFFANASSFSVTIALRQMLSFLQNVRIKYGASLQQRVSIQSGAQGDKYFIMFVGEPAKTEVTFTTQGCQIDLGTKFQNGGKYTK